ncbi:transcriptional regulatory protein CssR [Paenibacillus antibioticophila]|uniref:Transcriptional regulatory protein CssR n=1 Tax=Paenibacillus antibioticophila TaxID=1274374 RepID=A0A919XPG5_9BACL|nr:response regulator transcription factor [Paenibacillus antibioticophila]GIO36831.1 transcriptional regulatory protein CssR [Paenibacillus antibioticophila]
MYTIYLVEDEISLNQLIYSYMLREGWNVVSFTDGEEAKSAIGDKPHLWILDIMLPGMDGYQLIREIRKIDEAIPVIFISARDSDLDRINGLELGSDDYLAKPFQTRELIIRVRKLMERVYGKTIHTPLIVPPLGQLEYSPYTIDRQARIVREISGQEIELTSKEFDLLLYMVSYAGQVVQRERILDEVWGRDYFGSDRVVDDLIWRLRKKMPELRLETLYGLGYRLVRR